LAFENCRNFIGFYVNHIFRFFEGAKVQKAIANSKVKRGKIGALIFKDMVLKNGLIFYFFDIKKPRIYLSSVFLSFCKKTIFFFFLRSPSKSAANKGFQPILVV